jgi:TrmH family RNA methyltransferase
MKTITSPHNPRLKALRKLTQVGHRSRTGLFAAEGEDLLAAAAAAGWQPVEGFRAPGAQTGDGSFHEVEPAVLAAVSTLGSGTRAIAVYEQRWGTPKGPLCVYLHGVGDPGNVGAVLRGALAFGAASVVLGPGCADPYSPKAVRASMGAIFAVALAKVDDLGALPGRKVALVARAGRAIWEAPRPPLTLLVGAERDGLPPHLLAACDEVAHIPIASESLNAAMAATVALYETTRPSTRVPAS